MADRRAPSIDSEEASLLYCDEILAGDGTFLHLDEDGSVSALAEAETGFVPISEILRPKGDPPTPWDWGLEGNDDG